MREGQTMPLALMLLIGSLFTLPLLGLAGIAAVRRFPALRFLSSGLLLSGLTAAILTTFFGFSIATVPVGPYERAGNPWPELAKYLLLFLYVGFGLGTVMAGLLSIPAVLVAAWLRARRAPQAADANGSPSGGNLAA